MATTTSTFLCNQTNENINEKGVAVARPVRMKEPFPIPLWRLSRQPSTKSSFVVDSRRTKLKPRTTMLSYLSLLAFDPLQLEDTGDGVSLSAKVTCCETF